MCTGFIYKGNDLIYGFNFDVDPEVWSYAIYKTKNYFTIGITMGSTTYFTHGVNVNGNFGNLPYMNGEQFKPLKNTKRQRIDLLIDKYIRNKISFDDIKQTTKEKTLVNIPKATMHSLIGDSKGRIILLEPGYGTKEIKDNYAVIANFPILANLKEYNNPFYGKDHYDKAKEILSKANNKFNVEDGLKLLNEVKQDGQWGTRISFVYSKNNNSVYYCLDGDFNNISIHKF